MNRSAAVMDQTPTPVVKVRMYPSGYSPLPGDHGQTSVGTGAIHFIDHDRPMRRASTDHEQVTLSIPHHLIG